LASADFSTQLTANTKAVSPILICKCTNQEKQNVHHLTAFIKSDRWLLSKTKSTTNTA